MAEPTGVSEVTTKGKIRLPLWAWAVVGGVVLGGGYLIYSRRKAAAAAAAAAATPTSGDQTGTSAGFTDPTTILPIFSGSQPTLAPPPAAQGIPQALSDLTIGKYTVTGKLAYYAPSSLGGSNPVTDRYPGGVAAIVYGLAGNPHNPDVINIAADTVFITLQNPDKIPPYANGTVINYTVHPETLTPAAAAAASGSTAATTTS